MSEAFLPNTGAGGAEPVAVRARGSISIGSEHNSEEKGRSNTVSSYDEDEEKVKEKKKEKEKERKKERKERKKEGNDCCI